MQRGNEDRVTLQTDWTPSAEQPRLGTGVCLARGPCWLALGLAVQLARLRSSWHAHHRAERTGRRAKRIETDAAPRQGEDADAFLPDNALESGAECRQGRGTQSRQALAELCHAYWYPVYALSRSLGDSKEDAEDLTQSFFAHLIEHQVTTRVDLSSDGSGRSSRWRSATSGVQLRRERTVKRADASSSSPSTMRQPRNAAATSSSALAADQRFDRNWPWPSWTGLRLLRREYVQSGQVTSWTSCLASSRR